jgi:hypothetical protein
MINPKLFLLFTRLSISFNEKNSVFHNLGGEIVRMLHKHI